MCCYVSIDIETTGLNPETCQIIEFAAVMDNLLAQEPLDKLPRFNAHIWSETYTGEPYALGMHANFFRNIAGFNKSVMIEPLNIMNPADLMPAFAKFLKENGYTKKINVAGKNFAGFDKRFIEKLPNADNARFHHRVLDPAMLYFNPCEDDVLPDMKKCLERAGMSGEVPHTALEDALLVIKLIRHKFPKG